MRIAVNTISTKKGAGGAYQIAYNFLMETLNHQDEIDWYYITSSDLDELVGGDFKTMKGTRYFVFPTQPDFKGTYRKVQKELAKWENDYKPDVIYTISSPCYFTFKSTEVMRFANAWITNPNKYAWKSLSFKENIRKHLYCINQQRMLRKGKYFITQSATVGKGLIRITHCLETNVRVVPNVLPLYFETAEVKKQISAEWIDIACIAAQSPHKNLPIIPDVLWELKKYGILNVRFHITLPTDIPLTRRILDKCKVMGVEKNIINHGRCTQQQLCEIYNKCSICFLPTLLETFSASSLEAMLFGLKIVVTDFEFNREVIDDAGVYFRPMDAKDASNKIIEVIQNKELGLRLQENMKKRLPLYKGYENHYRQIVQFLKEVVEKDK